LYGAYELNPVALAAQASVPIPDGLDLDAWIVPQELVPEVDPDAKARKVKKGKGKEANGGKAKNGKKRHKEEGNGVILTPPEDTETPEQAIEREQVCIV
jgi:AP-3 complex subunit delta-1